jgi:hypothetical protein
MLLRPVFAILLLAGFSASGLGRSARAAECEGVRVAETIEVGGEKLVLNGLGLREATVFQLNVYVGALYLKAPSSDGNAVANADEVKLIRLSFLRDVTKGDMRKAITDGFKSSSGDEWPALEARAQKFFELLPAFEQGQSLTLWYAPGKGVQVKAPGKGSGTIEGFDFARALFRVWLGEHPPSAALKKGLLGGHCG